MAGNAIGLLRFEEAYFERIWGGEKLRTLYGKRIPRDTPIGEAWLIADHPQHEGVVAEGAHQGKTLRILLEENPAGLLGARPRVTVHGRFPLLLKILDAKEVLSVQVHPDDACAAELGEPDAGKTEMWHVLQADTGSELICGLRPEVTPDVLMKAVDDGSIERLMKRFEATEGTSVFVPAGTVHAIGAGVVLAEIQQNSDITYRLYDWRRSDASGKPRLLHIEKAAHAIHFGSSHEGVVPPPWRAVDATSPSRLESGEDAASTLADGVSTRALLASCPHFAAELVRVCDAWERTVAGETFHIVLVTAGALRFSMGDEETLVGPGQALLVPGSVASFVARGKGLLLDYYVPER